MKKKQLIILISSLAIVGIIITTLLATGLIPFGKLNTTSSSSLKQTNESFYESSTKMNLDDVNLDNKNIDENINNNNKNEVNENEDEDKDEDKDLDQDNNEEPSIINKNKIHILNNSSEYDIEMYSFFDKDKLFVNTEYYLDGVSKSKIFNQDELPEFNNVAGHDVKLSSAALNTKYAKVYFSIEKSLNVGEKAFGIYVLSLKDETIKLLYQGKGYGLDAPIFSPDKGYIAYNQLLDEKGNNSHIHIFESENDTGIIVDSKTKDGNLIGYQMDNVDSEQMDKDAKIYSYYITRWKTLESLSLREYSYVFDKTKNSIKDEQSYDISYNILTNKIIYPTEKYAEKDLDKQSVTVNTETDTKTDTETDTDTDTNNNIDTNINSSDDKDTNVDIETEKEMKKEPTKEEDKDVKIDDNKSSEARIVLENFYKYVTEGDYDKAYNLFDDNFESESKMFMGYKISKADITLEIFEGFAEATGIFNNAKIKKITKEDVKENETKIYYEQSLSLDPNKEPYIYPLVVTLKKAVNVWKITTVEDGV